MNDKEKADLVRSIVELANHHGYSVKTEPCILPPFFEGASYNIILVDKEGEVIYKRHIATSSYHSVRKSIERHIRHLKDLRDVSGYAEECRRMDELSDWVLSQCRKS